ncbi:MAG: hypothetical protein R3B90_11170 [Planctomycetaceae bacterium]
MFSGPTMYQQPRVAVRSVNSGANVAAILTLSLFWICGASGTINADDAAGAELTSAEQAFVTQLANRSMLGSFTIDGKEGDAAKEELYEIGEVKKIGVDQWTIEARIKYGKVDARVPVPVKVHWAGDTPMIAVTDLTIPLVGSEFSARVLFYGDRYAGTWQHGRAGGHMFGRLIDTPVAPPAAGQNE